MDTLRKRKATTALLQALALADGYPLADVVVRSHASDYVKPALTDEEWQALTQTCLNGNMIRKVPSKLDEDLVQYTITERGEAILAQ